MFNNMLDSFFRYERIQTTEAKAKELRRMSEKLITRAKENTLHNKRIVLRRLHDRDIVAKLFDDIAPKYRNVHGGYTRILKLGKRKGDGAEISIIELIDVEEIGKKKEKAKGGATPKKTPKPKQEASTPEKKDTAETKPSAAKVKQETPKAESVKSDKTKKPSKEIKTKTATADGEAEKAAPAPSGSTASKTKEKAKPAKAKPSTAKKTPSKGAAAKPVAGKSAQADATKAKTARPKSGGKDNTSSSSTSK
jgi:large subunit ribosomal protein L17